MKIECDREQAIDAINTHSDMLSEESAAAIADYYGARPELTLNLSTIDQVWTERGKSELIYDALTEAEIEAYYDTIPSDQSPDWAEMVPAEAYYAIIACLEEGGLTVIEVEVNPAWHDGDDILLVIGNLTD